MTEATYDDCRHRLPEPLPVDPGAPFVGNATRDDNLAESVRIALWNATGGNCRTIGTHVFDGHIVINGRVESEQIARRCETEVAAVAGVKTIHNLLSWND